ncbi:MAG: hypothetical protein MJ105_02455 [Lachnospiraceae bacterium]|nr:hypothetical protein [Lachnospiraceae bacterium]
MPKRPAHKMSMESRAKQFAPFAALGNLSKAYEKIEREMEESLEPKYASPEETGLYDYWGQDATEDSIP